MNVWQSQFEKWGLRCPKTGQRMTYIKGSGEVLTNISPDRIDSKKDYERGNIQFVCLIYNKMKNKYSEETVSTWCQHIINHEKGSR
tara:strand:- start:129 stop:386 length:258 start_codon:yes stop_codon:yes gene_type:complete